MERKKKHTKKLLAKRRAKVKSRKATGMQIDAMEDGYVGHELFSLASIKGKKELQAVDSMEFFYDDNDNVKDSDDEETHAALDQDGLSSDIDTDEEQQWYNEQLEELLDEAYERYVSRKGGNTKQRKRAKVSSDKEGGPLLEGDDEDELMPSDYDSDRDGAENDSNPLVIPFNKEEQPTQEQIMEKWFSQDVFAEAAGEEEFRNQDSDDEESKKLPTQKVCNEKVTHADNLSVSKSQGSKTEDFEVVPAEATTTSDESSSSDESEIDDDAKAEILAYAKKMLRKKQREQILDDAYNKYMFDDEGLPTWFLEEEKRHRQLIKPVTKEEIAAMRAQFKEIDARPAKKVAEAKVRKKRVAMRKLEKVRKKANSIADQTDISEQSKTKMIDRLYKKAMPKKPQKEYVVAKKGVQVKGGKGKVLVDRRMKKDARSHGMGKAGKGGLKKGKNAKGKLAKGQKGGKGTRKASVKNGNKGKKETR